MNVFRRQQGFTLLEVLLYVALAAVLIGVVIGLTVTLLRGRVRAQTAMEVEDGGFRLLQAVSREVRNAEAITTPASGGSGETLTLTTSDGTVEVARDGTAITLQRGGSAGAALTSPRLVVEDWTVENLTPDGAPGAVRMSVTLSYDNPSGRSEYRYEQTLTTAATLRPQE